MPSQGCFGKTANWTFRCDLRYVRIRPISATTVKISSRAEFLLSLLVGAGRFHRLGLAEAPGRVDLIGGGIGLALGDGDGVDQSFRDFVECLRAHRCFPHFCEARTRGPPPPPPPPSPPSWGGRAE